MLSMRHQYQIPFCCGSWRAKPLRLRRRIPHHPGDTAFRPMFQETTFPCVRQSRSCFHSAPPRIAHRHKQSDRRPNPLACRSREIRLIPPPQQPACIQSEKTSLDHPSHNANRSIVARISKLPRWFAWWLLRSIVSGRVGRNGCLNRERCRRALEIAFEQHGVGIFVRWRAAA